jgi:predicted peroxiredoxin
MKPMFVAALACVTIAIAGASVSMGQDAFVQRDGVFIHVSHGTDNPHRLLMALSMATKMADDHDVLVYFDIEGIDAVLKGTAEVTFAQFSPLSAQLAELRRQGITLMACPGCLKAAGKSADDLVAGVQVADKEKFFTFTAGRILTLDY